MTFLPIIERELRVRARARGTYWTRLIMALIGLLIALPPLTIGGPFSTPAMVGRGIYNGIVAAGFILSCCACFLTLSSFHREQREGTLGLVLLTRVHLLD